jgi:hypothetical protein
MPAFVINRKIARAALVKQRADEIEYAQLVKDNVSVAPIHSGLDGGLNEVFQAQFPDIIVPLAILLPPGSGPELPRLPPIPWTDNDGSLANRPFGALFGSNYASQTQVAWPGSTLQGQGADSGPRHRVPRRQRGPRFQIETDAAKPKSSELLKKGSVQKRSA